MQKITIIGLCMIGLVLSGCNTDISPIDAYYCHKYCNESFGWKSECVSSWIGCPQRTIKCKDHNVYLNNWDICQDKDGFVYECGTKTCSER